MLLALSGVSCSPKLPDIEFCVPIDKESGHCFFTLSEKERDLGGADWEALKRSSFVIPTNSWAEIKKYMLSACEQFNNCEQVNLKIEQVELH